MKDPNGAELRPVCKSDDLLEGAMMKVTVGSEDILVGRKGGKLFACNNSCPHKGASLSKGHMDGENIVCYMHGYEYNVFTGKLEKMMSWKKEDTWIEQDPEWRKSGPLVLYPISEEDGMVYVGLKSNPDS